MLCASWILDLHLTSKDFNDVSHAKLLRQSSLRFTHTEMNRNKNLPILYNQVFTKMTKTDQLRKNENAQNKSHKTACRRFIN